MLNCFIPRNMLPVKAIVNVAVACFVNLVFDWKRGLIYLFC